MSASSRPERRAGPHVSGDIPSRSRAVEDYLKAVYKLEGELLHGLDTDRAIQTV